MIAWILAVLGLFVAQTLLPSTVRYLSVGEGLRGRVWLALGPRDQEPPQPRLGARAQRALGDMLGRLAPVSTLPPVPGTLQ
jgi:hypothetical protein